MALRFAIIKNYKTAVGDHHEDIVYELQEEDVLNLLSSFIDKRLDDIKRKKYLEPKYSKADIKAALIVAFKDTIREFKKVTLKIF